MSGPLEQAWALLKFQPAEGKQLGQGLNQYVYGRDDDPNVTKVGSAAALSDMYLLNRNAAMNPLFESQRLIPMTQALPMEAAARFSGYSPVLSEQLRGDPVEETSRDPIRGRQLAQALMDQTSQGPLLEALGVGDVKPANWMQVQPQRGIPEAVVTGDPNRKGLAVIHDPMFYGATNPQAPLARFAAEAARGTPRRLGIDYTVPEPMREAFARRVDELPFDQFTEPIFESEVPMTLGEEQAMMDRILQNEAELTRILSPVGASL
tara:strand:+ start:393 stop:1184 length:792 start_codon:yes stop_codon:yes gene_type:complete